MFNHVCRLVIATTLAMCGCPAAPTSTGGGGTGHTSPVGGPCTNDADCGTAELCGIGGKCEGLPSCTTDSDCPTGELCDTGGTCSGSPSCTTDGDCPTGQLCDVAGVCSGLSPCTSNSTCPSGELCDVNGYCRGLSSSASVMTWSDVTPQSTNPPFIDDFPMVFDSARSVTVLFGGCCVNGGADYGQTWEWDGTAWTQAMPATSPPARQAAAMAFDSKRNVSVLFGGCANQADVSNCNVLGDTWEWDGTNWTQLSPATTPPPRLDARMAFDSSRGVSVLFGGCGSSEDDYSCTSVLGDTWEWDGTNWAQRSPSSSPPARFEHELVYDSARGVSVLFGGCVPLVDPISSTGQMTCIIPNSLLNDTWEWNGTSWTQLPTAPALPRRASFGMDYDSVRQVTLVFGGFTDTSSSTAQGSNDTWEWNGASWTQLSPALTPTARSGNAMAYDSTHSETVLFGANGVLLDDTWLLPSSSL